MRFFDAFYSKCCKVVLFLVLFLSQMTIAFGQDNIGPGRAIMFDGIDDYIDLGNIYDDLALPVTISVWVNISAGATYAYPIFNSQDNLPLYNGVTFIVSPTTFSIQYGDGKGENNPAFRRGKTAVVPNMAGRWVHLTGIMRNENDMELYLNGINVGGAYSGTTDLPMDSNFPLDNAKIGTWYSNGITTYFSGMMDELRIFNRSLSESEIRQQMCKQLIGNETGLVGYWTFNETSGNTLKDKSSKGYDGVLKNNPTRQYSGAPIGDVSTDLYTASWTGKTLQLGNVEVSKVIGNPEGVHIYKVNNSPSQANGLESVSDTNPYYGVFVAAQDNDNYFDAKTSGSCKYYIRDDNSISLWQGIDEMTGIIERKELLSVAGEDVVVDLGGYRILCDQTSYLLKSGIDPVEKSFHWSNGETTADITITSSGLYWLEVSNGCTDDRDTVNVLFEKKPAFSLGPDEISCLSQPKLLTPFGDAAGKNFRWHDGSTNPTFEVHDGGLFWVRVENICGAHEDTIHIEKLSVETADLGKDKIICDQPSQLLETGIKDLANKSFSWSTGQTTPSIQVTKSGIYNVSVTSVCGVDMDTVNIVFSSKPPTFDFGEDEERCAINSRQLKPYQRAGDFQYKWQDGSSNDSFPVTEYGKYWVMVTNACGIASDTIEFSKVANNDFEIPNIITPNGDPLNQYFVIEGNTYGPNHLTLFNRWGEQVFSSDDYTNDWDGGELPGGVYFYRIVGDCLGDKRGALTISR